MLPEVFKNRSKNEAKKITRKFIEFGSQNESKIYPKWSPNVCPEASRNDLDVNLRFVLGFGGPLGRFVLPQATFSPSWGPFGLPLDAFSEAFGSFCARNREAKPSKSLIKDLIASGREISPRSCRDSAENVPRTLQEPAENLPYEPQAKLPFTLRLLRKDFVLPQPLRQNRLE